MKAVAAVALGSAMAGCHDVELFCKTDEDCEKYAEAPFCDLNGEYAGSEFITNTCIANPFDATVPEPDAGVDAAVADAAPETDAWQTDSGVPDACAPATCQGQMCGQLPDGCGGTLDCEPCCNSATHQCVQDTPANWTGPVIMYDGTAGSAPPCTSEYPTIELDAGNNLSAGGTCGCDCDPATGMSCNTATVVEHFGFSCIDLSPDTQTINAGQCIPMNANMQQGSHYRFLEPGVIGGSCQVVTLDGLTTPTFADDSRLCGGASLGGICPIGDICVPNPDPGFNGSICIYRTGDISCPVGSAYSLRSVRWSSFNDTRTCGGCMCGSPTGTCGGTMFYESTGCASPTFHASGSAGTCVEMFGGPDQIRFIGNPTGTCAPSGSAMTGSATETGPTTICCTP